MSLLTKAKRKEWMKTLGYEYSKDGILKMQRDYFKRKQDQDGIYGRNTDNLLRHLHHVKVYTKNFKPEEFRCPCGHCTGYPTWMRVNELKHIQSIRDHYDRPMTITSGLRCEFGNEKVGGSSTSGHLKGKACDFYAKGVTDSVPNRNKALVWIKRQPHHKFTYGAHMVDSDGAYRTAESMGNAMHTEVR